MTLYEERLNSNQAMRIYVKYNGPLRQKIGIQMLFSAYTSDDITMNTLDTRAPRWHSGSSYLSLSFSPATASQVAFVAYYLSPSHHRHPGSIQLSIQLGGIQLCAMAVITFERS